MRSGMSADLQNSPQLLFPILEPRLPCAQADMPNPDEVVGEDMLPGIYLAAPGWNGKNGPQYIASTESGDVDFSSQGRTVHEQTRDRFLHTAVDRGSGY